MNMKKIYKYHYLYKITNLRNNKYYIGIHSTNDLNDEYMGSGVLIKKAIEKYGVDCFKKDIIQFVDSREDLIQLEKNIVNESIVNDEMSYNMVLGGSNFLNTTIGMITVRDSNGNTFNVKVDDQRRISGELVPILKGTRNVIDKNGNSYNVSIDDPRIKTGELFSPSKGMVTVIDKDGNFHYVSTDDERYISGELKFKCPNPEGRKHWKWVIKNGECKSIHENELDEYLQDGWIIGNIHKGLKCITKNGINKRVKPNELDKYLQDGWSLGTSQKYSTISASKGGRYVHKNGKCKLIRPYQLNDFLNNGWELGMKPKNDKKS